MNLFILLKWQLLSKIKGQLSGFQIIGSQIFQTNIQMSQITAKKNKNNNIKTQETISNKFYKHSWPDHSRPEWRRNVRSRSNCK